MSDGYIQVPTDSTGKKVDTTEVTRTEGTLANGEVTVERQRFEGRDENDAVLSTAQIVDAIKAHDDLFLQMADDLHTIRFLLEATIK